MAFLPDGGILITERPGRVRLVRDGALDPAPIAGVPEVYASGQGGLLDVALDPGFASNRVIYLSYAAPGDDGNSTRVARATLGEGRLEDVAVIFTAEPLVRASKHFGSRLASTLRAICSSRWASAGRASAPRIWARITAR
jgi:glucose/arabinose dehydrogenase